MKDYGYSMTKEDIKIKIQSSLNHGTKITEDQIRSLMILVRKQLELMTDSDRLQFLTLNLFCNWCAHVEITQSNIGLRILAKINDTLVRVKNSKTDQILTEMSKAIGFEVLRSELCTFLDIIEVSHRLDYKAEWSAFLSHLLEVIRDVPLAFPPISELNNGAKKIYQKIIQNPIKAGAGVIRVVISKVDYGALGVEGAGELWCLLVQTEDTTTIVVPLRISI